jgi:methylphosphotriester-DNA--protein-cysteine methyltransferase
MISMSTLSQIATELPMISPAPKLSTAATATMSATATVPLLDPGPAWQQVVARDPDAQFVYGVTTTGVFCSPSFTSRRPLRDNVRFFHSVAEAEAAGFRPCKRCCPTTAWGATAWSSPLDGIRRYIEKHRDQAHRSISAVGSTRLKTAQILAERKQRLILETVDWLADNSGSLFNALQV